MFRSVLHKDEKLLQLYRKHELTLMPKLLEIFCLVFIPWYLELKYQFIFSSPTHAKIFLAWTCLVGIYTLYVFLVWSLNAYLITSRRLLHITRQGLFKKTVLETPLDRILNVSFRTTGFFSTLFHYGDVLVQIVGLDEPLILKEVPAPAKAKDFIWRIHLEYAGPQKITYTQPEIAPIEQHIPYAPHIHQKINRSDE